MTAEAIDFLQNVLETPSPTGSEAAVAALVRERLSPVADSIETDVMGSVHARLRGSASGPVVMLAAHMDEIGLMVNHITDEGFLNFTRIGGVDPIILPGLRVDVHTQAGRLRGVIGRKPIHLLPEEERKNAPKVESLVIDLGLPGKVVKERVRVGDPVTFGVGFERFGEHMAVSRAFDDKAGVWVAVRVLEELARAGRAPGDFICAATVQEEIGARGATASAYQIIPDVGLAFDVTHATDYPGIEKSKHGNIVCDGGPVIARGPNINPVIFDRLVAAAEAEQIPYQIEAEPGVTGTDASTMQITRGGIACGLISIPLRYMHTPAEVISLKDLEATVKLITRFVLDLDKGASFVPSLQHGAPSPVCGDAAVRQEAQPEASAATCGDTPNNEERCTS